MKSGIKIIKDDTVKIASSIKALGAQRVMVGFPADEKPREDGSDITNAALGYIHNFGSPEANIPAREFMAPGILIAKDKIIANLKYAGKQILVGNTQGMTDAFDAAGQEAATGIKQKIVQGPFEPLKPATITARRRRSKGSTYRRIATSNSEVTPLIDTGRMWRAVTWVLRKAGGK